MVEPHFRLLLPSDRSALQSFRCAPDPRAFWAMEVQQALQGYVADSLGSATSDPAVSVWMAGELAGVLSHGNLRVENVQSYFLGVAVAYQGMGLGLQLKEHVLRRAKMAGAAFVTSRVRPENGPAIALNRAVGAREIRLPRDFNDRDSEDWLLFTVDLQRWRPRYGVSVR